MLVFGDVLYPCCIYEVSSVFKMSCRREYVCTDAISSTPRAKLCFRKRELNLFFLWPAGQFNLGSPLSCVLDLLVFHWPFHY